MGGGQDAASSARLKYYNVPLVSEGEEEEEEEEEESDSDKFSVYSSEGDDHDPEQEPELSSSVTTSTIIRSPSSLELRRRILEYSEAIGARDNIRQARGKLNRYTPGSSLLYGGGKKQGDFVVPDVTTLLLVGFRGAGKSTLVNNVIRVLLNKTTGFYKARISDDPSENGTYFMGEYMICVGSGRPRVSLFDTRGLSEDNTCEGQALLEGWMKDGVCDGQMDVRASDCSSLKASLQTRGRQGDHRLSKKRTVNFVIFVIDAVSVHKMKEEGDMRKRAQLVHLYKNPYLTFKDDRPVVVMTHGDKLSHDDRISTQIYLGEILGVPPVEQIFDISGATLSCKSGTEATVRDAALLDMLTSALERADRNLPYRKPSLVSIREVCNSMATNYGALDHDQKVALIGIIVCIYILFILFILACVSLSRILKKKRW